MFLENEREQREELYIGSASANLYLAELGKKHHYFQFCNKKYL